MFHQRRLKIFERYLSRAEYLTADKPATAASVWKEPDRCSPACKEERTLCVRIPMRRHRKTPQEPEEPFNCTFIVPCPAYVPVSAARFNSGRRRPTPDRFWSLTLKILLVISGFPLRSSSPRVLTRLYEAKQLMGDARLESARPLM